jgi:hypothetical protein
MKNFYILKFLLFLLILVVILKTTIVILKTSMKVCSTGQEQGPIRFQYQLIATK